MSGRRPGGGGSSGRGERAQRSAPPMLLQANRLFSWRQYLPAADLYLRLAETALLREPSRAPRLFVQAGRAKIAGGKSEAGIELLRKGLDLLAQQQRYVELHRISWRIKQGLEADGLDKQAAEIQAWLVNLGEQSGVTDWKTAPEQSPAKVRLPLACPTCEGVVDPADVEWTDEETAKCSYCGSLIHGEEI